MAVLLTVSLMLCACGKETENGGKTSSQVLATATPEIMQINQDSKELAQMYDQVFDKIKLTKSYKEAGNHNPLMTQRFGADPFVLVDGDRLYIYMTGDVLEKNDAGDVEQNSYSDITSLNIISTTDMVNWTDYGSVQVTGYDGVAPWAGNSWAPCAAKKEMNGKIKYFLYFANAAGGIGVLTADHPAGPFTDPINGALINSSTPTCSDVKWLFDPAVLVDDDGKAYLYFGGGVPTGAEEHPMTARCVELGEDMISLKGSPQIIDAPYMFEDSGINKIGDNYIYSYCTNWNAKTEESEKLGIKSAQIVTMTSKSPMGPFKLAKPILDNPGTFFGCTGNNHHCVFNFKDQWYIAYHSQVLEREMDIFGGYRSTHIDKIEVKDQEIKQTQGTMEGVNQILSLNPYEQQRAVTFARMAGVDTTAVSSGAMVVSQASAGDFISCYGVDFGKEGTDSISVVVPKENVGEGIIKICIDSPNQPAIGYIEVPGNKNTEIKVKSKLLKDNYGKHDVYFVFSGKNMMVDSWVFHKKAELKSEIPVCKLNF